MSGEDSIRSFPVPDLGEGLQEVTVTCWSVAVGDDVEINQTLCSVETAKAEVEIPSPYAGRIVELGGAEGDVLKVGAELVRIDTGPTAVAQPNGEGAVPTLVGYGAFAAIERHGVTVTALVPALAKLWAQSCEWEPVTPKSLRLLQVGGSKLEPEDARRVRTALTPGLQQVFGMAEGLLNFTRIGDPPEVVEHTQGRPLCPADELRIVNADGEPVGPGEEGELLVRGPYTLNGYFAAERDNERCFDPDGFYRSGDLVRRRDDGNLVVTGRVKDVICRAGETIAASDLEEQLLSHPAIFSAAAVGLPDQYLGEKICAAVVFAGAPITLAELNGYLDRRGVAAHTRPDQLVAMPALPTTPIGKIDKRAIVRQLGIATGPVTTQRCH